MRHAWSAIRILVWSAIIALAALYLISVFEVDGLIALAE